MVEIRNILDLDWGSYTWVCAFAKTLNYTLTICAVNCEKIYLNKNMKKLIMTHLYICHYRCTFNDDETLEILREYDAFFLHLLSQCLMYKMFCHNTCRKKICRKKICSSKSLGFRKNLFVSSVSQEYSSGYLLSVLAFIGCHYSF